MSDMPSAGDRAPDFEGVTQTGDTFRLQDALQRDGLRALAIYFYPKDDTPGCTKQACNLRDNDQTLASEGVAVVGVSADPVESHERFAEKYDLPFPLVADTDRAIMDAYGVYGEKNLYGKKTMGVIRSTVWIGPNGKVKQHWAKPKVP